MGLFEECSFCVHYTMTIEKYTKKKIETCALTKAPLPAPVHGLRCCDKYRKNTATIGTRRLH